MESACKKYYALEKFLIKGICKNIKLNAEELELSGIRKVLWGSLTSQAEWSLESVWQVGGVWGVLLVMCVSGAHLEHLLCDENTDSKASDWCLSLIGGCWLGLVQVLGGTEASDDRAPGG